MDSTPASVDATLPSLLHKVLQSGKNVVVKCSNSDRMERLDDSLWSFSPVSFMPHGTEDDDFEDKHPIYLTTGDENPNNADILILLSGATSEDFSSYARVLDMFEASDVQKTNARKRWKALADKGYPLAYYAYEEGKWAKKA
tara:strand:- start:122146 stop:122571 length:426 start_codon:yes stop_codon:yes gene_type:complete